MPKTLQPCTSTLGGVSTFHLNKIWQVCKDNNCFLIVRPSELQTLNLIDEGYPTKNMDIHDKSSNWGLTAGMVPVDKALNKKKESRDKDGVTYPSTDKAALGVADEAHAAEAHAGEAHAPVLVKKIQLSFTNEEFAALWAKEHTLKSSKVNHFVSTKANAGTCPCGFREDYEHYHAIDDTKYCFLLKPHGQEKRAFWAWRDRAKNTEGVFPFPIYVWAYPVGQTWKPVTGDYDMWMVAPHVTEIDTVETPKIKSVRADRGISAATQFTSDLIPKLNEACKTDKRTAENTVFNHGAEAQNFSFTQEIGNDRMAVFCPGPAQPFTLAPEDAPRLVFDMLEHGYVATLNPKWRFGHTLGFEDEAYKWEEGVMAEPQYQDVSDAFQIYLGIARRHKYNEHLTDPEKVVRDRETIAAKIIQRGWRARQEVTKRREALREDIATYKQAPDETSAEAIRVALQKKFNDGQKKVESPEAAAETAAYAEQRAKFAEHRAKFAIFRKIAKATGEGKKTTTKCKTCGQDYDATVPADDFDPIEFPEECFSPSKATNQFLATNGDWTGFDVVMGHWREVAREMALEQEGGFGRLRMTDFHGHELPVDASGFDRSVPGNKGVYKSQP